MPRHRPLAATEEDGGEGTDHGLVKSPEDGASVNWEGQRGD